MVDLTKIKFIGRYSYLDNHFFIFNGGSGLAFKMSGRGFIVSFESSPVNGYIYVIVDRDYQNKKKYSTSSEIKFTFDQPGTHLVDVVKANEANDNTLKLIDFNIDGTLLDYDYQYYKRVRVFGDSTIAGYGILEHNGEGSIENSDSVVDFCYHALYELGIETDIFSASGWGLAFSIYTCPHQLGVVDFIDKVATNKSNDWLDNSKYDLLIISLGTNDTSYIEEKPLLKQQRIDEYIAKYKKLIDSQTKLNKDIKILMIYGSLNEEHAYYLIDKTYQCLEPFYPNLFIHKLHGDNTGISNHAYVTAHEKMAEELKTTIKELFS